MTPKQAKMARTGLGWTTDDLATAAGVGRMTVARFERGDSVASVSIGKMQVALGQAGVDFIRGKGKAGVTVPE